MLMFLRSYSKFYINRDYVVTYKYTLTNIDCICVPPLIDDHIVCDPYH
jgi:hypothetical protein